MWGLQQSLGKRVKSVSRIALHSDSIIRYNTTGANESKIHMVGGKGYDDIKQFRLVQLPTFEAEAKTIASLNVKRNIIFGSRVHSGGNGLVKNCLPLLRRALAEAGVEGDQPQGVAALNGLSNYVRHSMEHPNFSKAMDNIILASKEERGRITFEAVQSVATQIPRDGHSVVGVGTYNDARDGWTELAKEFAKRRSIMDENGMKVDVDGESQLFAKAGSVFANIEYVGDENANYWTDAGGAMARFFFL